jgi:hypothetical protein
MANDREFSFRKLTNGNDGFWRVSWFGHMDYANGAGDRFSSPFVDVTMARLKTDWDKNKVWNLKQGYESELSKIRVPIEYLCALRLGDIWHNGTLQPEYNHQYREQLFRDIDTSSSSVHTIVASAKDLHNNYYLPFPEHPHHQLCPRVNCELIEISYNSVLLIPHYVILQAYFSSCSYVFRKIFQFGMLFDEIYDPSKSHIDEFGNAFIHLKKRAHDIAAPEVARMAFAPAAKAAVKMVSDSLALQASQTECNRLTPKTKFPFSGKTNLKLRGQWIKRDEKIWTFLAFEILSCSASLPFEYLEFFRDNPGDKNPEDTGTQKPSQSGNRPPPRKRPNYTPPPELEPDGEPDKDIEETEFTARNGALIKHLAEIPVLKQRVESHKDNKDVTRPDNENSDVPGVNTGDGKSTGDMGPGGFKKAGEVDDTKDRKDNEPFIFSSKVDRLSLFCSAVARLKSHPHVSDISVINLNTNIKPTQKTFSCYAAAKISDERWSTWHTLDREDKSSGYTNRNRELVAVKITTSSAVHILIEQERRISRWQSGWKEDDHLSGIMLSPQPVHPLSTLQLERLLRSLVLHRGILKITEVQRFLATTKLKSFKHPGNALIDEGDYVDAMHNKLIQLLNF